VSANRGATLEPAVCLATPAAALPTAAGPAAAPSAHGPPLRVLFDQQITATQRYGGVSRYVVELLRALSARTDVRAGLLAPAYRNAYLRPGDALHPLSFALHGLQRGLRWRPLLCEPLFRWAVATQRPQVVHETWYPGWMRPPLRGAAMVTTLHDLIPERFPELVPGVAQVLRYKRAALERADAVICISQATQRDALAYYPGLAGRCHVVWHGSAQNLRPAPPPPALRQPYLLFVGQRGGYKNFTRLVQAVGGSAVLLQHLRLLCFGGGAFTEAERATAHRAGLAPDQMLHIEGDDALLASAYRHARLFVYPSCYEGFGMPLTEAMAQGCAMACSRASSFPEVAGEAAIYFDPQDVAELRDVLERAALNDSLNAALAQSSRERAVLFSWQRAAEQTLAVYRSVLR
jgi:glycosyltransferase involved in cell wall biosynthesis